MLPTISAAESVYQKCLVVVLLTDCPLTTRDKGCRWQVTNNNDIVLKLFPFSLSIIIFSLLICTKHILL